MDTNSRFYLSDEERTKCIDALSSQLLMLRARAGISQEQLSNIIGISRQSYSAVERGVRRPSWNTFLSIVMFFDYNSKTHALLRSCGAFPESFVDSINTANKFVDNIQIDMEKLFGKQSKSILEALDEQAINNIKTIIKMEQERCQK